MKIKKISDYSKLDFLELGLRLWMAYILITNAGVGTIKPLEDLGLPPHIYQILKGMWDTGFMMHLVKITELVTGLMLLFNLFVPIALIALIPVVVNIYGIHIFLFHSYLTQGLWMLMVCGFLVYRHRVKFRPLLSA